MRATHAKSAAVQNRVDTVSDVAFPSGQRKRTGHNSQAPYPLLSGQLVEEPYGRHESGDAGKQADRMTKRNP